MGHCHGRLVTSPSFGFRPAFPWNMTACDSKNLEKNPGAYTWKLTFGTEIIYLNLNVGRRFYQKQKCTGKWDMIA